MNVLECLTAFFLMPLQLLFEVTYRYAFRLIENAGLAIIALSLVINLLVLPLYRRADAIQEDERRIEAKLAPGVAHIKRTFKGDERTMMLQTYYRQHHYSPLHVLRSSVSLLLQIPFFIAAYRFLSGLDLLKGVAFGPIADLSQPDGLIVIGTLVINFLPVLMTGINLISTIIFTKGQPIKSKIQLYVLAAFFLIFLYDSPSGLVFYWTLNNLFSLIKTIFYKLKDPQKVLRILALVCGVVAVGFGVWLLISGNIKKGVAVAVIGVLLCLPAIIQAFRYKGYHIPISLTDHPDRRLFFSGAVFLALLSGALIPSALIGSSPQEFLALNSNLSPIWYLVCAFLIAFGTFVFWGGVFYLLATPKTKVVYERILWLACGLTIVNYLFFGKNLGIISVNLSYETGFVLDMQEKLINLGVLLVAAGFLFWLIKKWQPAIKKLLLVGILTMVCMSGYNVVGICKGLDRVDLSSGNLGNGEALISLSRTGQNVIVFMIDRALGVDLPYIFNEKPELKQQFDGFTTYSNVVSFGGFTNFGTPPIFGGYEYTPMEMNARVDESLVSKQNEALKVMPKLFSQAGYEVTVCDPPYAGYQWVPDLSVFSDINGIRTYNTVGFVTDVSETSDHIFRNFFCYSVMKMAPSFLQGTLYDNGSYNYPKDYPKDYSEAEIQDGVLTGFKNGYAVLKRLSDLTGVSQSGKNSFVMFQNDTSHYPTLLQTPDYTLAGVVDNTAYDEAHRDCFTLNGKTIQMEGNFQKQSYHANMAAFLQIGKWLDTLKKLGVYDNSRIIIVSDHGANVAQTEDLMLEDVDLEYFYPVLLVKDFNTKGFTNSDVFMTTADVPTLALQDLISNPVNPYTGKPITNSEKTAHDQVIFWSDEWDVNVNNGNTFLPGTWYSVHDDLWQKGNWTKIAENTVLP